MCSTNGTNTAMIPFGMKLGGQAPYLSINTPHLGIELHRAQLQEYTQRLQLGLRSFPSQIGSSMNPLSYHGHLANPYLHPYFYKDPRARFIHEEPKPNHSYIGLIAMAILSSRDKKLVLSDIYQWILDNYNYFRTRGPGWRNSIRHNLSLNDCFIKAGRSANGKGHYWAIHPANVDDFQKGDFRRRRAQRRVRKHMGLSVPDDEDDDDSPAQSPVTAHVQETLHWEVDKVIDCTKGANSDDHDRIECHSPGVDDRVVPLDVSPRSDNTEVSPAKRPKRMFDMDSILAPDDKVDKRSDYKNTDTRTSAIRDRDVSPKTVHYSSSDSESSEHKRHAVDLSLSRELNEGERYTTKRPYLDNTVLRNSDPSQLMKLSTSPSASVAGKAVPCIPQFMSGLQRGAEIQQRVSAFRNAGAYNWASLSGYLSNYQLMALSSQHQSLLQRSAAGAMDGETGTRWQQLANGGLGSTHGLSAKEPSSQRTTPPQLQED